MPRISSINSISKASATLAACAEAVSESANGLGNGLSSLSRLQKTYSGFGEGVCTCARCMRRAGPIREDVENKLVQVTYALANVYDDSPDLEVRVTDEHRAQAEQMMACVESGDVATLREAFLEVEEQESEGTLEGGTATEIATYLIISAAQVGQADVIRLLAEWDADMEETDSIRRGRPLMHAANNGHTAAVKAMIECGADPEATDDNGYTALMVAVFSDRSSAAEVLVDGGACVDAQDRAGRTALSYAAMYGSTDCIYLLASRGADVGHIDHDGNTPLELAEGSGRQSAVDALKKLQLRVKMQEKRKVKASKGRSGCSDLDAAALEAKEAEAARAAAELLEQLEKEEAAKTAKAAKKKKKGKGKSFAADADAPEPQQQEDGSELLGPAIEDSHAQQQHFVASRQRRQQLQQQQRLHGMSHSSSATAGWPSQGVLSELEDSAASKAADSKHPRKQLKQCASTSPGARGSEHIDVLQDTDPGRSQGHLGGGARCAGEGDGALRPSESAAHLDLLRHDWEALLELAARCKDMSQQPTMLARVAEMLPRCSDAGISVKYGRKVLQRLQAVEPARRALQAALATQPCSHDELEAALTACKVCRCLLEDDLLQVAEDVMATLISKQEDTRLQQQQQQQRSQPTQLQPEQSLQQHTEQQLQQHTRQDGNPQYQPRKPGRHDADTTHDDGVLHGAQRGSNSNVQEWSRRQTTYAASQQQQAPHCQLQRVQQWQQQQQESPCPVHVALQQPPQHTQSSPAVQQQQQQQQQQHTSPQVPQQQLQQQPLCFLQQHQGGDVRQQPPSTPGTPVSHLHQQKRPVQQHLQQQQQSVQVQHPQFDQQLLQPRLQQLLSKSAHAVPVSSASPGMVPNQHHQQQRTFSQLQLLQQQQHLFASHMQGSQQQPGYGQLQRQLPGVLGASGLHPGLMSPSPVGTPPAITGSPGMLSHQVMPAVSQAAVRLQQQQQLNSTYWLPSRPGLVQAGAFGSVGQPVAGGVTALNSRLSMEMLPSGPGLTARGDSLATAAAAAEQLVRRGSLGTPAGPGMCDADVLDDLMHPAYAMANALLSDDEQDTHGPVLAECTVCQKSRCDTCCLPCGCLLMCQGCAAVWQQRAETICPFCKSPLDDFALV